MQTRVCLTPGPFLLLCTVLQRRPALTSTGLQNLSGLPMWENPVQEGHPEASK